jgi:hypothetical protein
MPEETVEMLQKIRVIEHVEVAITDLRRYGTSSKIVNTIIQLHDALANEYNEKFGEKSEEKPEPAKKMKSGKEVDPDHPTLAPDE